MSLGTSPHISPGFVARLARRRPRTVARPAIRHLVITVVTAATVALGASQQVPFPSPLDGPGTPPLTRSQTKRIGKAWSKLEAGKTAQAAKTVRKVADTTAGSLLSLQIQLMSDGEAPLAGLSTLCAANPGYAAAWATLAAASEITGDEVVAVEAAMKVSALWPDSPWGKRAAALESRWVDSRIASARALTESGDLELALVQIDDVLMLQPTAGQALMIKAEILHDLGRDQAAEEVLRPIAEEPEARMLMAQIAEENGQLFEAMQLYISIPAGTPGRDQALRRVKLEWRRQNLPGYVQEALESDDLNRAELAVVLVGLVPEANAIGGGQTPVLSDIVDLPSQREVVTVVRLGLLQVDYLQHQFDPDRSTTPSEARAAVDRLCRLLDIEPPPWCAESSAAGDSCVLLESPVSGTALADVILQATQGESQ